MKPKPQHTRRRRASKGRLTCAAALADVRLLGSSFSMLSIRLSAWWPGEGGTEGCLTPELGQC